MLARRVVIRRSVIVRDTGSLFAAFEMRLEPETWLRPAAPGVASIDRRREGENVFAFANSIQDDIGTRATLPCNGKAEIRHSLCAVVQLAEEALHVSDTTSLGLLRRSRSALLVEVLSRPTPTV